MNKKHVIFNLTEAAVQIQEIIKKIRTDPEYGFGEFQVEIKHTYHHLNTAWNAQNCTENDAAICSEENFGKWRKFPDQSEFLL